MTSRLAIMMGGRVAEEMIFGHDKVTSGAQSDIDHAERPAAGDDRRLVDGIGRRHVQRHDGVAALVVGGQG
jgi:hypothetical protein